MSVEQAHAPGQPHEPPALAELALGLRLIALAVVAGSGALLLRSADARALLVAGILASALFGWVQSSLARRRAVLPGEALVLVQVAVWVYLLHISGGPGSPLFIGLLLEVPLTGTLLGRRGCVLAGGLAAGAYLTYAVLTPAPLEWDSIALVVGSIAVAGVLAWMLLGILERQRAAVAAARSALSMRAERLATELRLLGDYLGAALLSVDDMGRVASINQAAAAVLGLDRQSALGRPWQEVVRPDPATAERLTRTLAEGTTQRHVPALFHRVDGVPVGLLGDLWVSPSQDGRRMHLLFDRPSVSDAADDPVHRLGEAAACVAHQFKNSLHALRDLAFLAERDGTGRNPEVDSQRFLGALRSLSELTDDVLAVAGTSRPPREDIPLAQAVASAVLLARPCAVRVTVEPAAEELHVMASRGPLVHALYNLIDNACRATAPGGNVCVRIERAGGRARIDIVDGGPGLPPGVDGARGPVPSREGSGLGLLAARRFLESGAGDLSFATAPGGGTWCRVTLPMGTIEPARASRLEPV